MTLKPAPFWWIEGTKDNISYQECQTFDAIYRDQFFGKECSHYFCETPESGTCVFSIFLKEATNKQYIYNVLARMEDGSTFYPDVAVKAEGIDVIKTFFGGQPSPLRIIQTVIPHFPNAKLLKLVGEELDDALLQVEDMEGMAYQRMKVGVLLCREGQVKETEMFGNKDSTDEFTEFLDLLGDEIQLSGFTGYRGDLDISPKNLDGPVSRYAVINGGKTECMYHVSTLLCYRKSDQQQLERKRYIGNDNVVIVFQESGCDGYKCDTIVCDPNHAIIAVKRVTYGELAKLRETTMKMKDKTPLPSPSPSPMKETKEPAVTTSDDKTKSDEKTEEKMEKDSEQETPTEEPKEQTDTPKPEKEDEKEQPQQEDAQETPQPQQEDAQETQQPSSSQPEEPKTEPSEPSSSQEVSKPTASSEESQPTPKPATPTDPADPNSLFGYRVCCAYKSGVTRPYLPQYEYGELLIDETGQKSVLIKADDKESFRTKLYSIERSTWTAPQNFLRLKAMRNDAFLRVKRKYSGR